MGTPPIWNLRTVQRVNRSGMSGVSATVVVDGAERELWFLVSETHAGLLSASADPFITAMLAPAVFQGATISSEPPVSAALLRRVKRVEGLFRGWLPAQTAPIRVSAEPAPEDGPPGSPRVAAFFAGGVDSFDTAIRNLESPAVGNPRLTHAIFVAEFDGPARRSPTRLAEATQALGLELILVRTNLRQVFPMDWEWHRGTALAAVGHALAGGFREVLIPSSQSYAVERAAGSYPILDEACSTAQLRITHDGADAHRAGKIRRSIATSPVALAHLHCCTSGSADHRNCGACDKCRETMLGLAAAGALGSATTFPAALPRDFFRGWKGLTAEPLEEALSVARESETDPKLVRTLERLIPRLRHRAALRKLIQVLGRSIGRPVARRGATEARP